MKKLIIFAATTVALLTQFLHAEKFTIDTTKSLVEVDVKATGHNFTGVLKTYKASIEGQMAKRKPSKVTFEWDFSDLETGKAKRDAEMLKWITNGHKGTFKLTSFGAKADKRLWAKGTMEINKTAIAVEFPCKVLVKGNAMVLRGNATLDTQKFGLPIIKMMKLLKVNPLVTVRFTLRGSFK